MIPVLGHDLVRLGDVVSASGRPLKRFLRLGCDQILMVIVLVAAVMGLPRLASHATQPADDLEPDNRADGGLVIRYEWLRLWLPQTLTDLAKRQSRSPVVRVHADLKRFLELRNQEDLWYALTVRAHQVDGGFADVTFIRRPYHDSQRFPKFLAVLATAAGNPPHDPDSDFSTASVSIFPDELGKREARQVLSERLGIPPSHPAQGRTR